MTVLRGFAITIASTLVCGLVGAGLGFEIGRRTPDYYRVVFRIPPNMDIDPSQLGLVLGFTQGLIAGLVTGLVIVAVVAWYRVQVAQRS